MYVHKKSGRPYNVVSFDAQVKIDGEWKRAITYKSTDPKVKHLFTRLVEDFHEKFVEVQQESNGIRTPFQRANRGY